MGDVSEFTRLGLAHKGQELSPDPQARVRVHHTRCFPSHVTFCLLVYLCFNLTYIMQAMHTKI